MVAIGWKGSRNRCQKAVVVVAEHRSSSSCSALILQIARSSEQYEQPSWQGPFHHFQVANRSYRARWWMVEWMEGGTHSCYKERVTIIGLP